MQMPKTFPKWAHECAGCKQFWDVQTGQHTMVPKLAKLWGVSEWEATKGFYEHFHNEAGHVHLGFQYGVRAEPVPLDFGTCETKQ